MVYGKWPVYMVYGKFDRENEEISIPIDSTIHRHEIQCKL